MTRPRATGRTRCPGCEHLFTDEPARPTAIVEGREPAPSSSRWYKAGRAGQLVDVEIRWHADCLAAFEEQNTAYRNAVAADRRATIEQLARDNGLDVDAALAAYDARQQ